MALLTLAACDRAPSVERAPSALPVDVYADTGRSMTLHAPPPPEPPPVSKATVWLARVSPARAALPEAAEAVPETLAVLPPPPGLAVDEGLKPPLPRTRGALAVPPGARGTVELDVRVDEEGGVPEVLWAGGARDPAMVRAAIACARGMRFFPAQRAGRPVSVWCRQRFDFGGGP
jgi:TonB family protein